MSEILAKRRHKKLIEKESIHKLLSDSYRGGEVYRNGGHLWFYSVREPKQQFDDREKRAIYINLIRPLLDILSSFIFTQDQAREYPASLKFALEKVSGQRGIEQFMHNLSLHSGLYTTGVLVDSPSHDRLEGITNLKAQMESGLHPYPKLYMPWMIRDFEVDDMGNLSWVLLDDTETNKSDPLSEDKTRTIYTLWDSTQFRKYEITKKDRKIEVVELPGESGEHPIGYVPFKFVNWRDIDDDLIADTPFETAAIIARQIYNVMSYLDEMLAGGTFKHLFYPAKNANDVPKDFKQNGVSGAAVTIFNPDSGGIPFYAGPGLGDVPPFIQAIEFYKKNILAIFGMDEDHDKKYVQSGVAKSLEFSKAEAMLRSASKNLESTEKWIMETIGKWIEENGQIKVEYQRQFQQEDIESEISRLFQVLNSPYQSANKAAWSEIIKKVLANLDNKEMKKILEEIESTNNEPLDMDGLINDETQARGENLGNTQAVGEKPAS